MLDSKRGASLYAVLRHVRPLTLASARVVEEALRERGVTVGMRAVLEALDALEAATVPQIAATLDLKRQGVQRLVDELIAGGYAVSQPNPRHRRSRLITATQAGRDAFDAIRREEDTHLARLAGDCSEAEIAAAAKVLSSLHRDIRHRLQDPTRGTGDTP